MTLGSRLLPLAYGYNATMRSNAVTALATICSYGVPLNGMMTVGGAVMAADASSGATSVTPAWRSAIQHIAIGLVWGLNATMTEQATVFEAVYNLTSLMRGFIDQGSGAYFSESDYAEPDWQESFWGKDNYARLQRVKEMYDRKGVFGCHNCVELPSSPSAARE